MSDLFVVKQTFLTWDRQRVREGKIVRAGHPLMKGRENFFKPLKVDYDVLPDNRVPERAVSSYQTETATDNGMPIAQNKAKPKKPQKKKTSELHRG